MIRYLNYIYSLFFGIAVALFFGITYKYHLHYQEQFQLFVFDWDYFWDKAQIPGGFAGWLGRFFTQFYYISWLGAAIVAFLLVSLQLLVNSVSSRFKKNPMLYPLSFLPSIVFLIIFCDENYLLGGLMGLILVVLAACILFFFRNKLFRLAYTLIMIPLLYWMCGGVFILFIALALLAEILYFKQLNKIQYCILLGGSIVFALFSPWLANMILQYPAMRLYWGIEIHRVRLHIPTDLLWAWGAVLLIPLLYRFIPSIKKAFIVSMILFIAVMFTGGYYLKKSINLDKEAVMAYDYFVRTGDWDGAIAYGKDHKVNSFISLSSLNLSLAMKDRLTYDAFSFPQYGVAGLVPGFVRDYTSSLPLAELYYHLDVINVAQRFYFEAMEAIPDQQKSGRSLQRLAETNLINGQYEVASRYLSYLEKTIFYKKWAQETASYLYNEDKINAHPKWGKARKLMCPDERMMYSSDTASLFSILLNLTPENKMIFDYTAMIFLMDKNVTDFAQVIELGRRYYSEKLPVIYQEALLIWCQASSLDINQLSWRIDTDVLKRFNEYLGVLRTSKNPKNDLAAKYKNTYWYYNQFGVLPQN
ncbi:DUF6057 family protein [Bacteroidales bacterium OttesenSCG-928-M11]|nr:DUF6057 family protein [Bacteroidales bacterium OttesenSCG-928-M11]